MTDIRIIPSIGAINVTGSVNFRGASNSSVLFLTGSGGAGLGTATPDSELHIVGSQTRFVTLDRTGTRSYDIGINSSKTLLITDNTAEADRISLTLSGSVGIGVTSPSAQLHVNSGGSFTNVDANNRVFIERNDHAYILFSSPNGKDQGFHFRNTTDNANVGRIAYQHRSSGDFLTFRVGGTGSTNEYLIISSNGSIRVKGYGTGARTGTVAYNLAVDSSGNIIETAGAVLDGSGTANYIPKWSDSNTLTDSVIYDNGANIGIGTSSPTHLLSLERATEAAAYQLNINSAGSISDGNYTGIRFSQASGGTTELGNIKLHYYTTGRTALSMGTRHATQAIFIDNTDAGNVGIGSTAPEGKLNVVGGADVLLVEGSGSTSNTTIMAVDGNNGRLFEVSDDLSDSLFSVNTIAGLPVMEVFADNRIVAGAFNQNDLVISGSRVGIGTSSPSYKLHVTGSAPGYFETSAGQQAIRFTGDNGTTAGVMTAIGNNIYYGRPNGAGVHADILINNNGSVGLGTTSPGAELHVYDSSLWAQIIVEAANDGYDSSVVYTQAGTVKGITGYDDSTNTVAIKYGTFSGNGIDIKSDGNVGIGLTDPAAKLEVLTSSAVRSAVNASHKLRLEARNDYYDDSSSAGMWISDGGGGGPFSGQGAHLVIEGRKNSSRHIYFKVGDTTSPQHVMLANGNVGINTTGPTQKLEVNGSALIDNIYLSNTLTRLSTNGSGEFGINYNNSATSTYGFSVYNGSTTRVFGVKRATGDVEMNGDLTVDGIITAKEFHTTFVSASIIYQSGSTQFGNSVDDTHTITGRTIISGSTSASPSGQLNVYAGQGAWSEGIVVNPNGSGTGAIFFRDTVDSTSGTWFVGQNGVNEFGVLKEGLTGGSGYRQDAALQIKGGGDAIFGFDVGIGTTSPTGKFNSYISATRQVTHNGNGGDLSVISDNNSSPVFYVKGTGTADLVNVYDGTVEVFSIKDGGNVDIYSGLGSNNVNIGRNVNERITLSVTDANNTIEAVQDSDNDGDHSFRLNRAFQGTGENDFIIQKDGAAQVLVNTDGNVGIGNTNPLTTLQVGSGAGSLNKTAALFVPNANALMNALYVGHGSVARISTDAAKDLALQINDVNKLIVSSSGQINLADYGSGNFTANSVYRLAVDANGNVIEESLGDGAINGLGASRYMARWVDTDSLTTSSMYEDGNGNIGIGTITPGQLLQVEGNADINGVLYMDYGSIIDDGRFRFGSDNDFSIGYHSTSDTLRIADGNTLTSNVRFAINSDGNIGIGTTSPAYKLDVNGAIRLGQSSDIPVAGITHYTNGYFYIKGGASGAAMGNQDFGASIYLPNDDTVQLVAGAAERMRIDTNGNVGIGTTSPAQKLHVRGGLRIEETVSGSNVRMLFEDPNTFDFIIEPSDDATPNIFRFRANSQNSGSGIRVYDRYEQDYISIRHDGSAGVLETDSDGGSIYIRPQSSTALIAQADGNVGIGTVSPTARLHVTGEGATQATYAAKFTDSSGGNIMYMRNDGVVVVSNGYFYVDHSDGIYSNGSIKARGGVTDDGGDLGLGGSGNVSNLILSGSSDAFFNKNVVIGGDNKTPTLSLIYDDHANGPGWDTGIYIGSTNDLPNPGGSAFPTYTDADGFGIQFQANSDGAIFGIEQYTPGHYRPFIGWGDDAADSPFSFKHNGTNKFEFSYDGNFQMDGNLTVSGTGDSYFGGSVGIGTTSPLNPLTIAGDNFSGSYSTGRVTGGINMYGTTSGDNLYTPGVGFQMLAVNNGGAAIAGVQNGSDSDQIGLAFFTHPSGTGTDAAQEKMRITYQGKVGIDTTNPNDLLQIGDTLGGNSSISIASGGTSSSTLYFRRSTTFDAYIQVDSNEDLLIGYNSANLGDNLKIISNTTNVATFNSSGNLGIGATSPASRLHVAQNTGTVNELYVTQQKTYGTGTGTSERAAIVLGISENGIAFSDRKFAVIETGTESESSSANSFLAFSTRIGGGINERMRIDSDGNVGIGTTSPEGKLDVVGSTINGTAQSDWSGDGVSYGAYGDLTISRRHGATKDSNWGFTGPLVDFRSSNAGSEWSVAQIMGTVDPFGGSNHQGGLVFLTSAGGTNNPAGRRNAGDAPKVRMAIGPTGQIRMTSDLTVDGIITAREFHTEFVNASVIYDSGSTKFGNSTDDTHDFTGSLSLLSNSGATGLTVARGSSLYAKINNDSTRQIFTYATDLDFRNVNGTSRMFISGSGNVGIGVTDPDQKLEVNGTIKSSNLVSSNFSAGASGYSIEGGDGTVQTYRFDADRFRFYNGNVGEIFTLYQNGTVQVQTGLNVNGYITAQNGGDIRLQATNDDTGDIVFLSGSGAELHRLWGGSGTFNYRTNGGTAYQLLHTGNYTTTLDTRYYTETEADSRFVNVTGDTMTGTLVVPEVYSAVETSGTITNNNWYRIIELSGGSGRGSVEFSLSSGGGSGTPFSFRAVVDTAWSNSTSTATIYHNAYGKIDGLRVVRNATANKSYVDVKTSGEDNVAVKILATHKQGAAAVNWTDVNTLPSGDSVETEIDATGKATATATNTTTAQFSVRTDGSIDTQKVRLPSGVALDENSNFLYIDPNSSYSAGIYINNEIKVDGGLIGSYNEDLQLRTQSTTRIYVNNSDGNVGIGTTDPKSKLHFTGGHLLANVTDNWQQGVLRTHLLRAGAFSSSIDENSTTLKIYPGSATRAVGDYWGGISFMHLDPENSSWGTSFPGDHFWIGGRIIDQPAQERSALVFATNNSTTGGSHSSEKMVILPNGNVGIGTDSPQNIAHIHVAVTGDANRETPTGGILFTRYRNSNDFRGSGIFHSYRNDGNGSDFEYMAFGVADANDGTPISGSAVKMVIDESGKVGIGKIDPSKALDVVGEGTFSSYVNVEASTGIRSTAGWVHLQRYQTNLHVAVGNNGSGVNLYVPNGKVGIGMNTPSAGLHISSSYAAAFAAAIENQANDGHGLIIQAGGTSGTRYITQWKDAAGTERFHMDDTGEAYFQNSITTPSTIYAGAVESDAFHMKDMGDYITFYGDNSTNHSIASRDTAGNASDDLRINSYHNIHFNLDSNNNNTNGVFTIGHHGGGNGTISDEVFRVQDTGEVGIGTDSPVAKLQVVGSADVVNIEGSGSATNTSIFSIDGNNGRLFEVSDDLSDSLFSVNTIAGLPVLEVFADNRIVMGAFNQCDLVVSGSRVGIGTCTPAAKLNIVTTDSTADLLQIDTPTVRTHLLGAESNNGVIYLRNSSNSNKVRINTNGDSYFNGGNVGINTTNPGSALSIVGKNKNILIDKGNVSFTAGTLAEIDDHYAFAYYTLRNGSTTGFFITNVDTNTPAIQVKDSSDNAQDLALQPYGGSVGIGTTSPGAKLDVVGNIRTSTYYNFNGNPSVPTTTTAAIFDQSGVGPTITGLNVTFRTGTPTPAEVMRVASNGNVGIGETSPAAKLHITHNNEKTLVLEGSNNTTAIHFYSGSNRTGILGHSNGTSITGDADPGDMVLRAESGKKLLFGVSGGGYHTATSTGRLGIMTQSPDYTLDVAGTGNFDGVVHFRGQADNPDGQDRASYWGYDGNVAAVFYPAANDGATAILFPSIGNVPSDFGYIAFDEDYGEAGVTAGENSALIIGCENDGLNSSDHVRVKSRLVVEADMSSSDPTEAFQVKSGNVTGNLFKVSRAGATTINDAFTLPTSDGTSGQALVTNGSGTVSWGTVSGGSASTIDVTNTTSGTGYRVLFIDDTGTSGETIYVQDGGLEFDPGTSDLNVKGNVVSYATSDRRLKDNLKPIENASEKISKISGYEFDWNNKQTSFTGHDVGVVAQEIEEVLPEVVTERKDGYKAVKYEKIVALLIEGMKEQQKEIEELKERINQLEK